jgi:pSer/pThr/pTyr-binding forkhead associated (FHA) protein
MAKSTCSACSARLIPLVEQSVEATPGPVARPRTTLVLVGNDENPRRMDFEGDRIRLGRHPLSEWFFPEDQFPSVSHAHAVITREGSELVLVDLGSTNGTFVNGARVHRHVLVPGDEIRLGQHGPQLRLEIAR